MITNPVEQVQQLIADARREFAADVDVLLSMLRLCVDNQVGDEDALRVLRRFVLEKFDRRLSLQSTADPVLLLLVREAYDLLNNPDSPCNLRDWTREADRFVKG